MKLGALPMSTIARTSLPETMLPGGDSPPGERYVVKAATWDLYDCLSEATSEYRGLRFAFDGEDLEIMTVGPLHDWLTETFRAFITILAAGLDLEYFALGQTTWRRPEVRRGIQADLCFYFDYEKIATARAAIARKSNDVADYPNPDLAVEIDLSEPKVDRSGIYEALKVSEVWKYRDGVVTVEHLGADGKYFQADKSLHLWLTVAEINHWITSENPASSVTWPRRLEAWVDDVLNPRADDLDDREDTV
jgi:Uma2 family endonuclease